MQQVHDRLERMASLCHLYLAAILVTDLIIDTPQPTEKILVTTLVTILGTMLVIIVITMLVIILVALLITILVIIWVTIVVIILVTILAIIR